MDTNQVEEIFRRNHVDFQQIDIAKIQIMI